MVLVLSLLRNLKFYYIIKYLNYNKKMLSQSYNYILNPYKPELYDMEKKLIKRKEIDQPFN